MLSLLRRIYEGPRDINGSQMSLIRNNGELILSLFPPTILIFQLLQIVARDEDIGSNADVVYKITAGNQDLHFSISGKWFICLSVCLSDISLKAYDVNYDGVYKM